VTCAGHSTMSTGTFPATHGIPLNTWWDRETGKIVSCTEDPTVKNITYGHTPLMSGDSPWRLRVTTFSDELRLQSATTPRIVAMSMKARAAMTLGGHRADLVTWYEGEAGFVTSTAYAPGKVPFLQKYLAEHPVDADGGKVWDRVLSPASYAFADDGAG